MLHVFMQEIGGVDRLREELNYGRKTQDFFWVGLVNSQIVDVIVKRSEKSTFRILFPERDLHPSDQRRVAESLVDWSKTSDVYIGTHSLIIIYTINNRLVQDPNLEVEAIGIKEDGTRESVISKKRWIDEGYLGCVGSKLQADLNRILSQREVK